MCRLGTVLKCSAKKVTSSSSAKPAIYSVPSHKAEIACGLQVSTATKLHRLQRNDEHDWILKPYLTLCSVSDSRGTHHVRASDSASSRGPSGWEDDQYYDVHLILPKKLLFGLWQIRCGEADGYTKL
jgi:hypothetical protein